MKQSPTAYCISSGVARFGLVTLLAAAVASLSPVSSSAQEGYEGGRGLITLEGPSGLFINPTSGSFPEGAATAQYCIFLPNNETDVVGHGALISYGVTDDIEVGVQGSYIDLRDADDSLSSFGPNGRLRLLKDEEGGAPEVSIIGWSRIAGDDELEKIGVAAAAFKRFPIDEDGPIRSVGLHVGVKHIWIDQIAPGGEDTSVAGYGGLEVQLPLRVYAVGEIATEDEDFGDTEQPYSAGLQWRAAGLAMSIAAIQDGVRDEASFYYGIGYSGSL